MAEDMKTPVAVVGVGRMGRHHARLYHQLPESELLAVVDADLDRARTLAEDYHCDAVTSVEALLEKYPQLKAASVAVPTEHHEAVAGPLLDAQVACLVEKPLAGSTQQADAMVERATKNQTLLQVGHSERFNPAVRAIRQLAITPRFIEVDRVSPMSFRSIDVGVVFDLMIHDLDIILMLVKSDVREIRAVGVALLGEHEDIADARIEFANGCVVKITTSRLALKTERKLRIFSETGYVSLDYAAKTGISIQRKGNVEQLHELRSQLGQGADLSDIDYTELVDVQTLMIEDEEPLHGELRNFLAAVRGEAEPEVTAEQGRAAVHVAEQVVRTIRAHHWDGVDMGNLV